MLWEIHSITISLFSLKPHLLVEAVGCHAQWIGGEHQLLDTRSASLLDGVFHELLAIAVTTRFAIHHDILDPCL